MDKDTRRIQFLVAGGIWLTILSVVALVLKFYVFPTQAIEKHNQIIQQTGSDTIYQNQINVALDSFSGYAVLRSQEFQSQLGQKRIKVNLFDDKANYTERLKRLQSNEINMAVFTIDALIKSSAELGDTPATIVALLDETRGADAMIAYKSTVPSIDAINTDKMKIVLTPNSPSETLARVVISHFGLRNLQSKPFEECADADAVFRDFRQSKLTDQKVFVLWEPYVSKALENPNVHVLVDSSRFRGYIVDVLVVNRDYLVANEGLVKDFVEAYFRSLYAVNQNMNKLVQDDAVKSGEALTDRQVERLVNGIWWKNTSENFAHFGINNGQSLQHVEDMIINVTDVLLRSGAIKSDPTNGRPNSLAYNKILLNLYNGNFHPGDEKIRKDSDNLAALNAEQWTKLVPVGTLEVPPLVFARGTSVITEQSQITLDELAGKLKSWPQYYLSVKGNATLTGDIEANKALAQSRAEAVEKYLLDKGIGKNRVRAVAVEPSGSTSVLFQLGYLPY